MQSFPNMSQDTGSACESLFHELREAPSGYAQLVYRLEVEGILGNCIILDDEGALSPLKTKAARKVNEESIWLNHLIQRAKALDTAA